MINIDSIKNFFPVNLRENPLYYKYLLKEYLQLQILDHLSTTSYIRRIVFIHPVRKTTSLQEVDIRTELLIFNIFFQSENIAFRTSSQRKLISCIW